MKIRHGIFAFLFLSLLFIPSVLYSYNAPDPVRSFYGDATGDMSVAGDDLSAHRTVASGGSATYATTQPQTGGQYWNTCDLSGDGSCAGDDIPSLIGVASGGVTSYSLSGWEISNYDLNETGNGTGAYPFRLSVAAGSIGRPGVIIKVTIESDSTTTGSLVGRTCTPGSDPDELNTSDDQCAVAVTVTDFYGDTSIAPTESGTTGLRIQADAAGTIHLLAEVIVQTGLLVPAMTLDLYPEFTCSSCNTPPINNAPASVTGYETPYSVGFSTSPSDAEQGAASLTSSVVSATGVCTNGSINSTTGRWSYTFSEVQGPTSCNVVTKVYDGYDYSSNVTTHVIAQEWNVAPGNGAPSSVGNNGYDWPSSIGFTVTRWDVDVPVQSLPCSFVSATGACTNGSFNTTTCRWSWMMSEAQASTSCNVVTRVSDTVVNTDKTTRVIVRKPNTPPVDNAPASVSNYETPYSVGFTANPTDVDSPPQILTCSWVSATGACTNGFFNTTTCRWSYTFTEAQGTTSCNVVTRAYDGMVYSANKTTRVIAREWNVAPVNNIGTSRSVSEHDASGNTYLVSFSTSPTDQDIPVQTLTGSIVSATGFCTNSSFSGSTWYFRTAESQGPGTCSIVSRIYDGVTYSSTVRTTLTVNEVNLSPTWAIAPTDVSISGGSTYSATNGSVTDADLPNDASGKPGYIASCSATDNCSSFNVSASCGPGAPPQNVSISFSPPATASAYTCGANITVSDSWSTPLTATKRMTINVYSSSGPHVSGTIQFQKVPISSSGLDIANPVNRAAKRVLVQLVRSSDSVVVGAGYTNDSGGYNVRGPASTTLYVRTVALMKDEYSEVFVVSPGGSSIYTAAGTDFALGTSSVSGKNYLIPDSTRASGPFNILDVILQSYVLVHAANPTSVLPALEVDWSSANSTQGTYYSPSEVAIYLLGDRSVDSEEFDDHVIAHEYGHYITDNLYRNDSIGGSHALTDKLDVRVAYSEGFANAFCCMGLDDPYYWDSYGVNGAYAGGFNAENNAQCTTNAGFANEASIYAILWDLYDTPSDNNDTLDYTYSQMNNVWTNSTYLNDSDYIYLYPFVSTLIDLQPADSVAIKLNLGDESVLYPEPAGSIFTNVTLNYTVNSVAINGTNGSNKFVANKYYRFTLASTSNVRVTTTCAINIDVYVQRKGVYVGLAQTTSGNETLSMNALPAGTYVVNIRAIQATSGTFNMTIETY